MSNGGIGLPLKFASAQAKGMWISLEVLACHELGQILQHTFRGALGDDEAVEHVDVGPTPPRTAVISLVVSVSPPTT